jgi:hypothetical protein
MKENEPIVTMPDGRPAEEQPIWRKDFPIDWPEDELRARRDFTRFLMLTSLAFVVGQFWIVLLRVFRKARGLLPVTEIARLDELPVGSSRLFEYPGPATPVCSFASRKQNSPPLDRSVRISLVPSFPMQPVDAGTVHAMKVLSTCVAVAPWPDRRDAPCRR